MIRIRGVRAPTVRMSGRALCSSAAGLLMLLFVVGCASAKTEITSFVDPQFQAHSFSRILIAPRYADLGDRAAIESAFVKSLDDTDAEGVPSMGILLPTRDWKDDDIFPLMSEQKIDAVLIITQTDAYQDREFVPERVDIHTDEYLSARSFRGGRRWGYGRGYYDTRITRSGGYYVDLPRVRNELRLYDVATRKQAWFATSLTSGDSGTTSDQMISSLGREAVAKLTVDGLIQARNPKDDEREDER